MTEIFARQFRVCFFSVSIAGSRARLFRWDRGGVVVTESFDFRAQPRLLCEFFWRFAQSDNSGRGHDTTVRAASLEEEAVFQYYIRDYIRSQLSLEGEALDHALSEHYEPNHVNVLHVLPQGCDDDPGLVRWYLVSRPVISPLLLVGKGTRGFWAVDASTLRVVFLKDTWRTHEEEGGVLASLNDCGVRNVPIMDTHGDVPPFIPTNERKLEGES